MAAAPRRLVLVDASGFIFRAYHKLPPLTNPEGTPVNAVYGFTNMLVKTMAEHGEDPIVVVFDTAKQTFRTDLYDAYKANRPEPPEDLVPQFPLVREAARAMGLPVIESERYEADDLIASYARTARDAGLEVIIISSDKDLMQLIGEGVGMQDPMTGTSIGPAEVEAKFGVGPERVVDVQALAGDSIDNVPGVPGIGVKTAAQLIQEYGDLDTLLQQAGDIKQPKRRQMLLEHAEQARLSRKLVRLHDDAPLPEPLEAFSAARPDRRTLLAFLEAQGFRSTVARVESGAIATAGGGTASVTAASQQAPAYALVQDMATLERWIDEARAGGMVAIDTETTSLDALRADLVGVSLALAPGRACYIPLAHTARDPSGGGLALHDDDDGGGAAPTQVPMDQALVALKPLLEDDSVLKIGQNLKYDMHVLARVGIDVAPIDDTMLLSYVLEGGLHGHGMDELAELFLAHTTIKYGDVAGRGKSQIGFAQVPLDKARDYAAEDADVTWRLHAVLKPRLVEDRLVSVYEMLERPLVAVLAAMERAGISVDAAALRDVSREFTHRLGDLEDEIHKLAGHSFNVGSPKQLGEVLFDEMGIDGGKKGKTGAYATGAEVLETLAAQGHELPEKVLEWRQLAKLKSTYADALVDQINPETGRVHTSYSQAIASTGRLSSNDPNLQNIPVRTAEGRRIRRAFVAAPGHVLLSADYSQIELRLLAHVADIAALKEAFRDGQDIHALTASQVFGVPVDGMDPQIRRKAKAINFGIIYGISPFGLARQLKIPRSEASAYIDAYFQRYPGIRAYMDRTIAAAREQGFVTTLFGRRVHVRGINDKNPSSRNFAERAAINAPIQGGAADIIKRAMVRIPRALAEAGVSAKMLLQVHDELIFEVPEAEVDDTRAAVVKVMEQAAHLSVPLVVDTGAAANWEEAH